MATAPEPNGQLQAGQKYYVEQIFRAMRSDQPFSESQRTIMSAMIEAAIDRRLAHIEAGIGFIKWGMPVFFVILQIATQIVLGMMKSG